MGCAKEPFGGGRYEFGGGSKEGKESLGTAGAKAQRQEGLPHSQGRPEWLSPQLQERDEVGLEHVRQPTEGTGKGIVTYKVTIGPPRNRDFGFVAFRSEFDVRHSLINRVRTEWEMAHLGS